MLCFNSHVADVGSKSIFLYVERKGIITVPSLCTFSNICFTGLSDVPLTKRVSFRISRIFYTLNAFDTNLSYKNITFDI